jgi:hypothetical protein
MKWQVNTKKKASKEKRVRTLMGRYRNLPEAGDTGPSGGHALRAAINTPIQVGDDEKGDTLLHVLYIYSVQYCICTYFHHS